MFVEKKAPNIEYCDSEWLAIVREQEEKLRFDSFTKTDARKLGNLICEKAEKDYPEGVSVKIILAGITVFFHMMEGTGTKNDWYMGCKYHTFLKTGKSSLLSLLERTFETKAFEDWCNDANDYILCGGEFPIRNKQGELLGCVIVSNLTHEKDHQLIVDSISEYLGTQVSRVELKDEK